MISIDKSGVPFEVKECVAKNYPHLLDMYEAFLPKAKFQGMPPGDRERRRSWVRHLTDTGHSFLAWRKDTIIGHVVLLPDFDRLDAEYLIFVIHSDRGKGVGSGLTREAISWARLHEIRVVWLTVDTYNFRAIHLYKKFGFRFSEPFDHASERLMVLHLGENA